MRKGDGSFDGNLLSEHQAALFYLKQRKRFTNFQ
jgi:hypothetical protein